ncbi:MAG TPA: hypothetical protein VII48_13510, partial [Rhizomicrobium sp.]
RLAGTGAADLWLTRHFGVVGGGGGFRVASGGPDQAGRGPFLIIQQRLQQMLGGDPLVEFPYRDSTGRLEKTLAAFGEFLQIHHMSLSSGDSRFMSLLREAA